VPATAHALGDGADVHPALAAHRGLPLPALLLLEDEGALRHLDRSQHIDQTFGLRERDPEIVEVFLRDHRPGETRLGHEDGSVERSGEDLQVAEAVRLPHPPVDRGVIDAELHQPRTELHGARGRARVREAPRVGDQTDVQADGRLPVELRAETVEELGHHDRGGRRLGIDEPNVPERLAARVVVEDEHGLGRPGVRLQRAEPLEGGAVEGDEELRRLREVLRTHELGESRQEGVLGWDGERHMAVAGRPVGG
jgi:hypothetical protein